MTIRNLTVLRTVLVVLTAAAVTFVPLTSASAQTTIHDRSASSGLAVKDGTEALATGDGSNIRKVRSYARSNYVWPYSYGPSYSVGELNRQGVVWTPAGVFQLTEPLPIAEELRAANRLDTRPTQVFVVQFNDELDVYEDLVATIEGSGGRVFGMSNSGSIIARLGHAAYSAVHSTVGFLAVEPYHGAFKLNPLIGRTPLPDPLKALSETYVLDVLLWADEDGAAAANAVAALGGRVTANWGDHLVVEIDRSLLASLADLDAVRAIHESLPFLLHAEETTTTMQTGQYNAGAIPYHDAGADGRGLNKCPNNLATSCTVANQVAQCGIGNVCLGPQILMVLDSGFQLDAGDLSNTRVDAGTASNTHRKVRVHQSTNAFGGTGDTLGCDALAQGGFTHGHVVAATALGNATAVNTATYGTGWVALDQQNNAWNLDGVAPGAVLVAYDGQITPPNGSCDDPLVDSIIPGDLYNGGSTGALGASYETHRARVINFSWGSQANVYSAGAADIDVFMREKLDALVFVSAGNAGNDVIPAGGDGIPDPGSLGSPATTKNGFAIGASRNANTVNSPESRAFFSSVGPAIDTTVNRIAPQLMAPGDEPGAGALGLSSEFACRTSDNNQTNPVECDIISGVEGTSFSSPAAAGTALVARSYFAQGFHPNGALTPTANKNIGAAALKALLVASADFMNGANLSRPHRWNNEQGYGRIQLDNVLPLETWPRSPTGLLVNDPVSALANVGLPFTIGSNSTQTSTFKVVNGGEELRVALAWLDATSGATPEQLVNNLSLKLVSPSGLEYRGNYFTDDNNQNGIPEGGEDCGGIGSANPNTPDGLIDNDQWSQPVCTNTKVLGKGLALVNFDDSNPTEAIFLSHDPQDDNSVEGDKKGACTPTSNKNANGPCNNNLDCRLANPGTFGQGECVYDKDYQQTELGTWTISVISTGTISPAQPYAVVIAGGVGLGSTVRFDDGTYSCNERVVVTVTEVLETGTQGTDNPTEANVEARTVVEVIDGVVGSPTFGMVVDSETGINFTKDPAGLQFTSDEVQLTAGTARDPGNGALDVRNGDQLRALYNDANVNQVGLPLNVQRKNTAIVNCRAEIGFGSIVFGQFGQDSGLLVQGGCERNARSQFEFGFPDRYMDADESIILNFAFNSNESIDLEGAMASLRCVNVDADSPKDCLPSGANCVPAQCGGVCDPLRSNNTPCIYMTVLDTPKFLGFVPAGAAMSANFSIQMAGDGAGEPFAGQPTPTVELLLELSASVSGKPAAGLAVSRQRLNVDTVTSWYSTDYPSGGTEVLDWGPGVASNNDEIALNPVTENANFQSNDYRFETFTFSALNTGGKNQNLLSPWNFDGNNGGFRNGLAGPSDASAANIFGIGNWGEDKNFNGIEDGICAANPGVACYNFGNNTDARCTAMTFCTTVENNLGTALGFVNHWNTKGGCGWQTRATGECTGDPTRGCFGNDDCKGTCRLVSNQLVSTFTPCSTNPDCPTTKQCAATAPINKLGACTADAQCGGAPGSCQTVGQTCEGAAGTCGAIVGDHTGGVWHTGAIGTPNLTCNGAQGGVSACANYKVIAGGNNQLLWFELLVSPVMQKVNTTVGGDGLPNATIEIFDWGWNANINLVDQNAVYSWELDTDLTTLDPVDLFSDISLLNAGSGAYGAITPGSNPALTDGWPVFAPQCACTTTPFGPCVSLTDCKPGSCTNNPGVKCHVTADCLPGTCTGGGAISCFSNADCPSPQTCTMPAPEGCLNAPTCNCTGGQSVNGSSAGATNRFGDAGCFFEGKIATAQFVNLGLAKPPDDDFDNDGDALVDEFVQNDGPFRNHDIVAFNGPDMRFNTLEDIYGDTGDTFQAAVGFLAFEGTAANQAKQSYGLALDDMVIKWREFTLSADATNCDVSGSCAVLELATSNVFQGQTVLTITVLDAVPVPFNDCDLDGTGDGINDCNGNSTPDVVVKATSDADVPGEIVFLDSVGGSEYKGVVAVSALGDSPGTVFISQQGVDNPVVTVTYLDHDIAPAAGPTCANDAACAASAPQSKCRLGKCSEPCANDVDVTKHGTVQTFTTIFLGTTCEVTVVKAKITADNGDKDSYADTEETVDMQLCLINNCGFDLNNCTGRLFSNSDEVHCIVDSTIDVGDLPDSPFSLCVSDKFRWKMTNAKRTTVAQALDASFSFTMTCDEIDALSSAQVFSMALDLDLDAAGQIAVPWSEGFEGGSLASTKFTNQNLDQGIPGANNAEGLINGDGWRCQYSDPDWPNSNSYGNPIGLNCYPGATLASANAVFWQVDGTSTGSPTGGRSKSGSFSGYYGVYLTNPAGEFTTPMAAIDAMRTPMPINLGTNDPQLNWWQQISLMDGRFLNVDDNRSADRGTAQFRIIDNAGNPTSVWTRLEPFQNSYDTQAYDFYFNCMFDPIDDGNTEDDFFDPSDPGRRLGPSSSCHPTFSYSCQGDTDQPFQVANVCNAKTQPGPGDAGQVGTGTWVQSKVDLFPLRGRRIELRYLVSGLKATGETHEEQFSDVNPGEWDNGWWIDDILIDETLASPAILGVDAKVVKHCRGNVAIGCLVDANCVTAGTTGPCEASCSHNPSIVCTAEGQANCGVGNVCVFAPQCGPTCSSVTVVVATTPDANGGPLVETLPAPGQSITLDAFGSFGTCLDGALQYRFSKDGNPAAGFQGPGTVVREYSENPILIDTPQTSGEDYLVQVRCSTLTSCNSSATVRTNVDCPSSGNLGGIFQTIKASSKTTWFWTTPEAFDLWQGALSVVGSYGGSLSSHPSATSFSDGTVPAPGAGKYYVVREAGEFCNSQGLWTSGGTHEDPDRETTLP